MDERVYNLEKASIQLRHAKARWCRWEQAGAIDGGAMSTEEIESLRELIELLELEIKRWS